MGVDMHSRTDLLGFFAHHKVAANLLMIMMILGGLVALQKLTVRYFPQFDLDYITITVPWRGASAEDVAASITVPLEMKLRSVDQVREMTSTSSPGLSFIRLELEEYADPIEILNQVKQQIDEFRNLPAEAEQPQVIHLMRYEQVARILLYGGNEADLRTLAHQYEQQLLDRGINKIDINGLPDQEISIEIDHQTLQQLDMSLGQVAQRITQESQDIPAGTFAEQELVTELRSLAQRRSTQGFAEIPLISDETTRILLGDVAVIKRQNEKGGVTLTVEDKPAVEMILKISDNGDAFKAARIFQNWLAEIQPSLPPQMQLYIYEESWKNIRDRIELLLKNGISGLVLVVAILYLFLSPRVALWVAIGIPVSFMATLLILYFVGGSINMISLFALIMALGIIVDDAIVVGEDALAHYQQGEQPLKAAESGARRMFAPVLASSLTTVAAFIPLMLVSGPTGKILFDIPLIICAVILASLIESFFVLPGHLRHSFQHMPHQEKPGWHQRFNAAFDRFKNQQFRQFIRLTLKNRFIALALVFSLLIVSVGLLAGQRVKFQFFPSPETALLFVNIGFLPGTPKATVDDFLDSLETELQQTAQDLSPEQPLLLKVISRHGVGISNQGKAAGNGDHLASLTLELTESDDRTIRNQAFINAWKQRIVWPPGLNVLTVSSRLVGPPGRDLTIRLAGNQAEILKQAALSLAAALQTVPGVSDIQDDLPFGRNQQIFRLKPAGEMAGLTLAELGEQLRSAFDGKQVQLFQDGLDEVSVRVKLPDQQTADLSALSDLAIRLPDNTLVPFDNVATVEARRGYEQLQHTDGRLAVEVTANVDSQINNVNLIIEGLQQSVLPELAAKYGIDYSFTGRSADQAETLGDMRMGLKIGLVLIYLILTWVFASYGWPLVVMMAIPFGLIGALLGHWLMGIDLTILSLFGLFGLSGIVINDSIILVSFYQQLTQQGLSSLVALEEAACQRFRAVLLTSLTTVAGLLPLLFETSLQAQFLIPMATSIAFGLMFSTVLVLLIIPVLLSLYVDIEQKTKLLSEYLRRLRADNA
jgi:multidrug efflux pump subunit AcrB